MTIGELARAGRGVLSAASVDPQSGRIRSMPDVRTIRYYISAGVMDRPLDYEGRTAIYGRRHLEQLVAIKRLQAVGATLDQIREQLSQLDGPALTALANLSVTNPSATPSADAASGASSTASGVGGRHMGRAFWRQAPAPVQRPNAALPVRAALLAPGATLVLGAGDPLTGDELDELTQAAAPLVATLERLGLLNRKGDTHER